MKEFSVFISYALDNEDDRKLVHNLARTFEQNSIRVWFADRDLQPDNNIYSQITKAIHESDYVVAICSAAYKLQLDKSQSGSAQNFPAAIAARALHQSLEQKTIQNQQIILILREKVASECLPCLLILDNVDTFSLPDNDTCPIEFIELLERLEAGKKEQPRILLTSRTPWPFTDRFLPVKIPSVQVQLTIEKDFESYTKQELEKLLTELEYLLNLPGGIRLVNLENGSVKVTIEIPLEQAEQLLWLYRRGVLKEQNITDARVIGDAAAVAIIEGKLARCNYDVFMCHKSEDKTEVKKIAVRLRNDGILPWIDEWELRPGLPWQQVLETQIENIKSAAIFVGNSGIGPWQNMELNAFIRQFVKRQCPVIPVVLRSCNAVPSLPTFLDGMTWVNFKKSKPNPYHQLVWGITGKKFDCHTIG